MNIISKTYLWVDKVTDEGDLNKENPETLTVKSLQTWIGGMGLFLAFWLTLGNCIFNCAINFQPSISDYYHTNMRDFFVGTLFSVAVFLTCYRGYNKWDDYFSTTAGVFAFLTAIFPTPINYKYSEVCFSLSFLHCPINGKVHFVCASLFLLTLCFMSVFLFTKTDKNKVYNENEAKLKKRKNFIHFLFGGIIFLSLLIIAIMICIEHFSKFEFPFQFVYVFESSSLISFSISWFTKAERFNKLLL